MGWQPRLQQFPCLQPVCHSLHPVFRPQPPAGPRTSRLPTRAMPIWWCQQSHSLELIQATSPSLIIVAQLLLATPVLPRLTVSRQLLAAALPQCHLPVMLHRVLTQQPSPVLGLWVLRLFCWQCPTSTSATRPWVRYPVLPHSP